MMTARASIRHFPGLWLPNRKPLPQERVRFDPGFAREFGLAGGWVFLNLAARDLTPNRKHANIVGSSIQLVSALAGTAAWFSGDNSTDRLDLGPITSDDPLSLVDAPGVTVAFRAFRESGATNNFPRVIDKSSSGSAQAGWAIWWTSNAFEFSGTGDSFGITFTYSATDQWDNVAFKGDLGGASIANEAWFLNGVSQSTSGNATGTFSSTTTDAAIGNWNHSTDREWRGGIEYVYVFATALPDSVLTNLQREPYRYLEAEPASAVVFLPRPAAGGTPTISPTGIASAAAFGDLDLSPGAVALSPNGLASAEAHGNATVQSGLITLSPSAVASAEAHGDATVSPGAVTLSPASIASAEAHGSPTMGLSILANAIASAAVFGAVAVSAGAATLSPAGLASAAAFGNPTASPGTVTLEPAGLASAEAHGAHTVSISGVAQSVDLADGISSAEAHGTITLDGGADYALFQEVTETSFSSATTSHPVDMPATVDAGDLLIILSQFLQADALYTFTTPSGWTELSQTLGRVTYVKKADGTEGGATVDVVSDDAMTGAAHVYRFSRWSEDLDQVEEASDSSGILGTSKSIIPLDAGVEADWVWIAGVGAVNDDVSPSSWPTGYTDNPVSTLSGGGVDNSGSISSSRRRRRAQSEDPGTVEFPESEQLLTFTIAVPPRPTGTVSPTAIPSSELFGTPITARTIDATAIASAAAFGAHDVIPGGLVLSPAAIASAEAHGTPAFLPGTTTLDLIGLPSDATFGQALLLGGAGLGYLLGEIDVYAAVSGRVDVEAALAGDAEVVVSLDARVRLDG